VGYRFKTFTVMLFWLPLFVAMPLYSSIRKKNSSTIAARTKTKTKKKRQKQLWIRVLLDKQDNPEKCDWVISSENSFVPTSSIASTKKIQRRKDNLHISVRRGCFYVNGKRFPKKKYVIVAQKGLLGFGGNFYKGSFLISLDANGRVLLINRVDLEDYIFAVLRSESWPGWPLEVNKVFAIATRSYVIAKVYKAHKTKEPFHIKSTKIHQTYNGHQFQVRNEKILHQAVNQTKGVLLTYDEEPIVAMFDSCCGGIVPSKVAGVDFDKAPYLARDYSCQHCQRCSLYHWQVEYDIATWNRLLRKELPTLKKIRGIKITKKDDAGLIQEIVVKDGRHSFMLTGKKLYSLLDAIKSFYFFIRKKGRNIVFKGRGYGHHLGLCQWGAREMVRDAWDYKKILMFYYPNVTFSRLA